MIEEVNYSKKYEDILKAARDLFWKHGFKRVSIEEICEKASVSKMTYYKYFPNKIELAKTVFNRVVEDGEKKLKQIFKEDSPASEKIKKMVLLKMEGSNEISPEFLKDFYSGSEPELKAFVEQRTRKAWDVLIDDFKEAQRKGMFRKDIKPEFLMKVQYNLAELFQDESLTGMYSSRQEMILEFVNLIFYGIAPRD